jgi:hypothetical protein
MLSSETGDASFASLALSLIEFDLFVVMNDSLDLRVEELF